MPGTTLSGFITGRLSALTLDRKSVPIAGMSGVQVMAVTGGSAGTFPEER